MLAEVAMWAEILGGAAVIGGILFGLVQLRMYSKERADRAAIEVVRSMLSEHFPSAYRLLSHLTDGLSVAEVRRRGPEYEEADFSIATVCETLGFMVFKGVVPLDVAYSLVGGVALTMWRKLETYAEEVGNADGQVRIMEWFEWLVRRLEEVEAVQPVQRAPRKVPLPRRKGP